MSEGLTNGNWFGYGYGTMKEMDEDATYRLKPKGTVNVQRWAYVVQTPDACVGIRVHDDPLSIMLIVGTPGDMKEVSTEEFSIALRDALLVAYPI